jgi:hypothetical protein
MTLNHQNAESYFKWCLLFVYNIIIAISNLYNGDSVERLTRMYKNNISVYSRFLSFEASFQLIKSPKYTMIFLMIYSMGLYYNHRVLEPFGHNLCIIMNTNALKTILLELVHSSFLSFVSSFHDIKSSKCTMLFLMIYSIHLYYNHHVPKHL